MEVEEYQDYPSSSWKEIESVIFPETKEIVLDSMIVDVIIEE